MNQEATVTIGGDQYRVADIKAKVTPVPKVRLKLGNVVKLVGWTTPYIVMKCRENPDRAVLMRVDGQSWFGGSSPFDHKTDIVEGTNLIGTAKIEVVAASAKDFYTNLARAERGL